MADSRSEDKKDAKETKIDQEFLAKQAEWYNEFKSSLNPTKFVEEVETILSYSPNEQRYAETTYCRDRLPDVFDFRAHPDYPKMKEEFKTFKQKDIATKFVFYQRLYSVHETGTYFEYYNNPTMKEAMQKYVDSNNEVYKRVYDNFIQYFIEKINKTNELDESVFQNIYMNFLRTFSDLIKMYRETLKLTPPVNFYSQAAQPIVVTMLSRILTLPMSPENKEQRKELFLNLIPFFTNYKRAGKEDKELQTNLTKFLPKYQQRNRMSEHVPALTCAFQAYITYLASQGRLVCSDFSNLTADDNKFIEDIFNSIVKGQDISEKLSVLGKAKISSDTINGNSILHINRILSNLVGKIQRNETSSQDHKEDKSELKEDSFNESLRKSIAELSQNKDKMDEIFLQSYQKIVDYFIKKTEKMNVLDSSSFQAIYLDFQKNYKMLSEEYYKRKEKKGDLRKTYYQAAQPLVIAMLNHILTMPLSQENTTKRQELYLELLPFFITLNQKGTVDAELKFSKELFTERDWRSTNLGIYLPILTSAFKALLFDLNSKSEFNYFGSFSNIQNENLKFIEKIFQAIVVGLSPEEQLTMRKNLKQEGYHIVPDTMAGADIELVKRVLQSFQPQSKATVTESKQQSQQQSQVTVIPSDSKEVKKPSQATTPIEPVEERKVAAARYRRPMFRKAEENKDNKDDKLTPEEFLKDLTINKIEQCHNVNLLINSLIKKIKDSQLEKEISIYDTDKISRDKSEYKNVMDSLNNISKNSSVTSTEKQILKDYKQKFEAKDGGRSRTEAIIIDQILKLVPEKTLKLGV